ncbi:MAG: arginase family protein [bacterium]|nr:arginase family protein [bacterium]
MTWPLHEDPGAFGGLPERPVPDRCRFAVLPIPYDGTSTWRKGADRGPDALLAASANMELYDIETASEPWRAGIVTMAPVLHDGPPEGLVAKVRAAADDLLDRGLTVVGLGGEHSVSIGLIQAHAARHPGLTVLQFDAHGDTRDSYEGSPNNHACVMARAAEVADYVQVGIRSLDAAEAPKAPPRPHVLRARDRRGVRLHPGGGRVPVRPGLRHHRPGRLRSGNHAVDRHSRTRRPLLPAGRPHPGRGGAQPPHRRLRRGRAAARPPQPRPGFPGGAPGLPADGLPDRPAVRSPRCRRAISSRTWSATSTSRPSTRGR